MTTIRKLTVGGLVGATLILGLADLAAATPATPLGVTATSTPSSTSTPSTSTPSSSSSTAPTTAPATTPTPKKSPSKSRRKSHLLTGREIWRIVQPHRQIMCSHAAKELKRIAVADAVAGTRMARWHKTSAGAQVSHAQNAAKRATHAAGKARGFQKLQNEGQALIKRIEAKCPAAGPAV